MKHYKIGKYQIDIYNDQTFKLDSADNVNEYDFIYFDKSEYQFPSVFGIKIFQGDTQLKSAIIGSIGGATGIHDMSAIVEDDRILICCSNTIFCLSIPELNLLWRTQADQGTCFEIYKYQDGYIIHGELEISRLDKDGKILWQRSGADIFTTQDGKDDFRIMENYILATDWENRKFKFDFNGNILP